MSDTSQPEEFARSTKEPLTSGLTKFPCAGASELPPLPKARRLKAVLRALILGIAGAGFGALVGLGWGIVFGGAGMSAVIVAATFCAIVGFIAGITGQPLETILGAVAGATVGAIIPPVLGLSELVATAAAGGTIIGAMTGAYMGELRSDGSTKGPRTK